MGSGEITAPAPKASNSGVVRLIPFYGVNSMNYNTSSSLDQLGDGSNFGLLADFGEGFLTFETGIVGSNNQAETVGNQRLQYNYWGVPLALKLNLSGKPNETVYLKAGGVIADETERFLDQVDLIGQGGVGVTIPFGSQAAALMLEANYQTLLTREAIPTNFNGWNFIAGVSVKL